MCVLVDSIKKNTFEVLVGWLHWDCKMLSEVENVKLHAKLCKIVQ